jgi:hypothetical protein
MINKANDELVNASVQWRKTPGQNYDPVPVKYRYLLVGVYFHYDDDAYDIKKTKYQIHTDYDVDGNEVIDWYFADLDKDPSLNKGTSGVASGFGPVQKYFFHSSNEFYTYLKPGCRGWAPQFSAQNMNHEVGHLLNLRHTWSSNDLCEDTPTGLLYQEFNNGSCSPNFQYLNCWTYGPNPKACIGNNPATTFSPCQDWTHVSNNIMDYNEQYPHAWTPCQIGLTEEDLKNNGNSYIHSCYGCAPPQAVAALPAMAGVCPNQPILLTANASSNENKYRIEICEMGAFGTNCQSHYFNSGWINGQADIIDLKQFYGFVANRRYKVTLTVSNSACDYEHSKSMMISTNADCQDTGPTPCCDELTATTSFNQSLGYRIKLTTSKQVELRLVNTATGAITTVLPLQNLLDGVYLQSHDTSALPQGSYQLQANFGGAVQSVTVVKTEL